MCVGDWRLGRLVRSVHSTWIISGSGNLVLPANPQRVALSVSLTTAHASALTWANLAVGSTPLTVIPLNDSHFHITLLTHGDLVTKSFTISQGSNASTGSWVEYLLPEGMLTEALETFRRQYPGLSIG